MPAVTLESKQSLIVMSVVHGTYVGGRCGNMKESFTFAPHLVIIDCVYTPQISIWDKLCMKSLLRLLNEPEIDQEMLLCL